ncbi:hypothetical protein O525_02895, partial [Staphylococcus aureus M0437]
KDQLKQAEMPKIEEKDEEMVDISIDDL